MYCNQTNEKVCFYFAEHKEINSNSGVYDSRDLCGKAVRLAARFIYRRVFWNGQRGGRVLCRQPKIPLLFFDVIIGGVISAAFIPVFNEYLEKSTKARAIEFANRFINVILILTGLICVFGILFAPQLIDLITPGLGPDTKQLAIHLSNILFPMIIFTGLAFSFVGILQSFGEFNIPAIISLVSNGIMILYLLIFKDRFGVTGLAVAMLIGWAMQAAVQIPSLIKFQYKYKLDFHFKDEGLKKTALLAIPLLISTWVQPIGSAREYAVCLLTRRRCHVWARIREPALYYHGRRVFLCRNKLSLSVACTRKRGG